MSYFHFMVPDTWNGFRDIDEKINFEELNRQLEEGEIPVGTGGAAGENEESPPQPPAKKA
jgi:hypothetical protein